MTLAELLPLAQELSVGEKLALAEAMLDAAREEEQATDSAVLAELHRRVAFVKANPDDGHEANEYLSLLRAKYAA